MNAEEVFLNHLDLIDRAIAYVSRRAHIDRQEAEEFASYARFKLIEADYAAVRKFEGRSSFATYITIVVQRLYFQYRVQMWGKWRPSAEARRLGQAGITLERLMTRDGHSFQEAVRVLTTGAGRSYSVEELEAIYLRLPSRRPRPVLVPEEAADYAGGVSVPPDDLRGERKDSARATAAAVDAAIAAMPAEDQLILRMRFWNARKISDIASTLGLDAKKLYKRLDRLLLTLRETLEKAGIDRSQVAALLDHSDHELSFEIAGGEGNAEFRHSMKSAGELPAEKDGIPT